PAVAAGGHRDLLVELGVAAVVRHALVDAALLDRGRHSGAVEVAARVDQRRVEARLAAEQLADAGGAEALAEAGTDDEIRGRLPARADLAGPLGVEERVLRDPGRGVDVE